MADKYRSERPAKRMRRLSFDDSDDENSSAAPTSSNRPRRAAAGQASGTTIERSSPDESRQASIRLTVKADPKKLKEATTSPNTSRRNVAVNSRDTFPALEMVAGPRQGRKKAIVEESSEEEDDDEDEETPIGYGDDDSEGGDEDAEGEEDEEEDEDMDAEGEEDEEMIDAPPIRASAPKGKAAKPQVTVTPAQELPSVEDKELAMDDDDDDDDDELSSLDEDAEGELDEELGEEDAEGEEDDDSDEEISGSRGDTPDMTKLTRRQRGQFEDLDGGLLALSNEAQKKKHLTAEEHAMRRSEMARRRKNLSEKRNEEEKMDTINRLLKKQAPKRRSKADREAERIAEEGADPERVIPKAYSVFMRYVQSTDGSRLGVPQEWVGAPFGPFLDQSKPVDKAAKPYSGRMVEEVA